MCGINGIFSYHHAGSGIDLAEMLRTRDHMAARGPDGKGEWISACGRIGFGHRRLSIIDLSGTGAQPMSNADGSLIVTFNGEIYNYRNLRRELESKGYVFQSNSDTEVLLHLYADRGKEMVHQLRGMFAFALWDQREKSLLVARDPYGIKPLYYCDDGRTFRVASQVKALLAGGAVSRDPDPAGQVGFLLWGSVPEPYTTYRAIRALPAGTLLIVNQNGAGPPRRYHSIAEVYCRAETQVVSSLTDGPISARELLEETREALLDSVRHHLVSDVPVGAFLSAGIDSGVLVGLMREVNQSDIKTLTIAFDEFRGSPEDESPLAAEIARTYDVLNFKRVVTEEEFRADLPKIFAAMDQPSIDGINTWFVAKATRELGLKVAISGLGGDELFGGYPSFKDIPRWVSRLAVPASFPLLGSGLRRMLMFTRLDQYLPSPKAAGVLELGGSFAGAYMLRRGLFMPWELDKLMGCDTAREGLAALRPLERVGEVITPCPESTFAKVATLESSLYMRNQLLRDTDWASMAHGLEVRVPLVDNSLLQRIAKLGQPESNAMPKACLAKAPQRALPDAVVRRSKTGFVTPVGRWIEATSRNVDRFDSAESNRSKGMDSRAWSRRVLSEALL